MAVVFNCGALRGAVGRCGSELHLSKELHGLVVEDALCGHHGNELLVGHAPGRGRLPAREVNQVARRLDAREEVYEGQGQGRPLPAEEPDVGRAVHGVGDELLNLAALPPPAAWLVARACGTVPKMKKGSRHEKKRRRMGEQSVRPQKLDATAWRVPC